MTKAIRNIFFRSLIPFGSILIIVGVVLLSTIRDPSNANGVIGVDVEDGKTQSIEFQGFELIPGSSSEYDIQFNGDRSSQFDVKLTFEEKEDKALKNFAYIKIISGDEVLYDKLLAEAFEDDSIVIPVDFEKKANTQLKIVYYLPIEVGNEAKNAGAKFDLLFTAQSKEAN